MKVNSPRLYLGLLFLAFLLLVLAAVSVTYAAVARIGGRIFTGFIAWLLWLAVHIAFLVGFRNRLGVLLNWAWNYIFYERAVRLILPYEKGCR
ncbi:MAG: hypothetical protein ACK47M_06065 [Caldilinea sp.]